MSPSYRKDREKKRSQLQKEKDDRVKGTTEPSALQDTKTVDSSRNEENETKSDIERGSADKESLIVEEEQEVDTTAQQQAQLNQFIKDIEARLSWKQNLRRLNNEASNNRPDDDKHLYKLDSSLKKNTAFIRKCRMISDGTKEQLIKEMKGLNLTKYLGELCQGLVECKLKMSDVPGVVEFCSAVHQLYAEFSPSLLECWTKVLAMKKEDKLANPSKLRVDLRLYSELISVGIFSLKESLSLLGNVLTTLVAQDKESLSNISIIISFCKHCGDDYAGLLPYSIVKLSEKYGLALPRANLLAAEKQKPLRNILKDYYQCLSNALLTIHKETAMLERSNRRQMLTRGEISAERKANLERLQQEKEKLYSNTVQMAEAVCEEMIILPSHQSEKDEEEEAELAAEVSEDNLGTLWDDDDTKAFYENFPDLIAIIPSILYKDSKEEAEAENNLGDKKKVDLNIDEDDDVPIDDEEVEEVNLDEDDEPEGSNVSNRMALDAFLGQLPHCVNREMIDNTAADFCMNYNTKSNRRKLVKALFTVHRTRTDLLPFYSRLCAILAPLMPDVPLQLCAMLKQEFRWQVRKKDQVYIESKLKVCRFIGEMVKFSLFPKSDALFCMKQLLFDLTHHHIDMLCTLVESCGSYLYRTADTHRRIKIYMEQMIRKKAALSMDARYTTMIENAYYLVIPTETTQKQKVERPPKHQYIRKLLYHDLNKSNVEKILRQVRKFDWENAELAAYLIKCLRNVWNVKYYNIRYLASLLAGLVHYHDWIGIVVTDDILEDIRLGMEVNNAKFNQRRTSVIKFLGELYTYRMVDSSLIFKVLYSLITFGVVMEHDLAEQSLDPPEHMLRLRLVCILLDTCGQYFTTGSSKKKLDYFLIYLQRYYWFKRSHPMYEDETKFPLGMTNLYLETISGLRPKLKMYADFEEACLAVQKVENEFISVLKQKGYVSDLSTSSSRRDGDGLNTISEEGEDEVNTESQHSVDNDLSHSQHSNNRSRRASGLGGYDDADEWNENKEVGAHLDDPHTQTQQYDEDEDGDECMIEEGEEDLVLPSAPVNIHCQEDDDFMAALDKMVNESITENKNMIRDKGNMTNVSAPPGINKSKKTYEQIQEEGRGDEDENEKGKVQVMVMLRKGGGGGKLTKSINVSSESELGEQFIAREESEAREKAKLKKLTLEISERQEEEELIEAISSLQRCSPMVPVRKGFKPQKGAPDADLIFGKKSK